MTYKRPSRKSTGRRGGHVGRTLRALIPPRWWKEAAQHQNSHQKMQHAAQLRFVSNVILELTNAFAVLSEQFHKHTRGVVLLTHTDHVIAHVRADNTVSWNTKVALYLHSVLPVCPSVTLGMAPKRRGGGGSSAAELQRVVLRLGALLAKHGGGWLHMECKLITLPLCAPPLLAAVE